MRNFLLVLMISLISIVAFAQDNVGINFAQTFSGFKFKDSQGNEDLNLKRDIKFSYAMNYEKIFKSGIYIKPELGFKNLGAKSKINMLNIEWDLHYFDINIGGGYIYQKYRLKPYLGVGFYYAFLYKGDQFIGSDSYDIMNEKIISKSDYGLNLNVGLHYDYSDYSGVFIEYKNSVGLKQLDNNINGGSKELHNLAYSIRIGLTFNIANKKSKRN
jgi:hypothetical protein